MTAPLNSTRLAEVDQSNLNVLYRSLKANAGVDSEGRLYYLSKSKEANNFVMKGKKEDVEKVNAVVAGLLTKIQENSINVLEVQTKKAKTLEITPRELVKDMAKSKRFRSALVNESVEKLPIITENVKEEKLAKIKMNHYASVQQANTTVTRLLNGGFM